MPRATVTSRVLKNKDTGLEIYVPTYNQTKELLMTTVHYQVVLASNLACFKSPSHKDSDVVQYSIERKLSEFEELRAKVSQSFPGTVLPPINKKSIIVNDAVLKERRNSLDHLMKCIASTPKLSTCIPVLVFLGVDLLRAKKVNKGEPLDIKTGASSGENPNDVKNVEEGGADSQAPIVFGGGDDSGNEDFFADDDNADDTNDLFGSGDDNAKMGEFKVFEGQDLKRELTDEDENDFSFVPDGILTKKETLTTDDDDHSHLFQMEDDLDKLMNVGEEKKTRVGKDPTSSNLRTSTKPSLPLKPSKPDIPSKPKPEGPSKPKSISEKPCLAKKPSLSEKPSLSDKSGISNKPNPAHKPTDSTKEDSAPATSDASNVQVENLDQDDIMKYLQDNLESNVEEVDLFS